jgi:hypothetical protein
LEGEEEGKVYLDPGKDEEGKEGERSWARQAAEQ